MNLRNVTIWTTGVMLLLTIAVPVIILFCEGNRRPVVDNIVLSVFFGLLFWSVFGGLPFVISYIIAKKLKYVISAVILLCSTIACGVWYFYALYGMLFVDTRTFFGSQFLNVEWLPAMTPVWISFMIPSWTIALLLNVVCANTTPDPGTTASTPSSPAP